MNIIEKIRIKLNIEHWKVIAFFLCIYDALTVNASYFFAIWLRHDFQYRTIPSYYLSAWVKLIIPYAIITIIIYLLCGIYRSIWRFASYNELIRCVEAVALDVIIYSIAITFIQRMPISFYILGPFFQFLFTLGIRFAYRFVLLIHKRNLRDAGPAIMIIGAGSCGQMLLRDISHTEEMTGHVACVIDDNPNKWHRSIDGVPIVGGRDDIMKNVVKYDIKKIYIALPTATAAQRRDIIQICQATDCEIKNIPGMYQLANGSVVTERNLRAIKVEDLLGREPIKADMSEVFNFVHNKVVMVTGGGGSIGSELCRQVAAHGPKQLIIFDVYENNAYDIQLELREKYPELDLVTLIGSVRDSRKVFKVFSDYRPDIVYHAAAHKHVPLMEDSPCESIKNNAIGTYKTAYAAMTHGCKRFVLISTDKAVNPTNIMGASKRLCEMIIQSFDAKIKEGKASEIPQLFTHDGVENADKDGSGKVFENIETQFVAVRFGNVLGSNGSVIPIFKKQIEKGGPVTVTHPDIIRYFMTIPEAVSLVMLAGTYAKGGEIFVLDMGSPVKIATLARNLIKMAGYKPDVDIKIEYSGLRPGEKLYEEKLMAEEGLRKTDNDLIHIGVPIEFDRDQFLQDLAALMDDAYNNDPNIREQVCKMVTTYHPENA